MCLGLPLRIVEVNGKEAIGELNGIKRRVRIDLIENLNIGEYVMVHAGFAIEKIEEADALETLEIVNELEKAAGSN
ncbi:HypC/HybG/HupF family hydrogenase formation chaperone [Clostridium sp. YIM B02515]|uniref:HypC/HybG/HupF family hydrogenase formation chaperone n=1 Tax=Clostridium rhizosphaerae TaxID=2803861 RepID=A0ABS1TF15_9CLOT|nr:HypC/HybG/HupF family hydrogenase formation chaperone [Clostridium rhizosphaerae]MBL4937966.1 HypC/HybG/HupF family hydrogenase formation chaperone [Clostridium rhizosphaerae]